MLYYFHGTDTYAARQAIEALAKKEKAVLRWIDKEETENLSPGQWLPQGSRSLFGVQLTVLRDVSLWPKVTQDMVAKAIRKTNLTGCIVWDRSKPDKRSSLYKNLKKHEQEFPVLPQGRIASWLIAEAKKKGGTMDSLAANLLIEKIGFDRWQLLSEMDKILLTDAVITRDTVERLVAVSNVQAEIFAMLDALSAGKSARALSLMDDLLAAGEPELRIMAMVAHQFRSLMLVQEGLMQGKNKDQIARDSGLHPYVVQKSMAAAKRYKREYSLDVLTRILAADFAMKQGKVDMRTGLVMFIMSLTRQTASA